MDGGGGSSNNNNNGNTNSCFMSFGGNMMMPLMTSTSISTSTTTTNNLFLPLPPSLHSNHNDLKAKIVAHPHYPRLLACYINIRKVGAPPEVAARLEEAFATEEAVNRVRRVAIGEDPALDQFMEAYSELLIKYEQELTTPFQEALLFLSTTQSQLKALALGSSSSADHSVCGGGTDRNGSSEDEVDGNDDVIDPRAEDRELRGQLLRKYSGLLGNLKQEFMKKKKKGKLPKEARQHLVDWWSKHYKWPYPSESQKVALAEATGLDQKQINNWFINQRKRHWKPSEDMQFMVMDAAHPHYYMDSVVSNSFAMDCTPSFL